MKNIASLVLLIVINSIAHSQEKQIDLKEITVISSPRIELPFSENSRTIQVISKEEIIESPANNVAELFKSNSKE